MDVISVYAAGIRNVVASLGTAFTIEQCRKLLRYSPQIYFCYDSDAAGQNAIMKAIEVTRGLDNAVVKVVQMPDSLRLRFPWWSFSCNILSEVWTLTAWKAVCRP